MQESNRYKPAAAKEVSREDEMDSVGNTVSHSVIDFIRSHLITRPKVGSIWKWIEEKSLCCVIGTNTLS